MAFPFLRKKNRFDKFKMSGFGVSNLDPDSFEESEDSSSFISPTENSLDISKLRTNPLEYDSSTVDSSTKSNERDWITRLREQYKPETEATERFRKLLDAPPEREEPSFMRKLVASGASLGNRRRGIAGGIEQADKVLEEPYNKNMADWKAKADQYAKATQYENTANANERYITGNLINAKTQADRITASEQKTRDEIASRERIAKGKNDLIAEKQNGTTFTIAGGKIIAHKLDGTIYDTGEDVKNYTPIEVANITAAAAQKRVETQGQTAKDVANIGATSREKVSETGAASREIYNIPDPNDPTKQIAVRIDPVTNKVTRVTLDDKSTGPAQKPGTPPRVAAGQPNNIQDIQNSTRETLNVLNELLDKDGKLTPETTSAVGKSRMLGLQYIPASQTRTADQKITRLKNRITIGLIAEMKAQSKTGATGFGQMNMRELDVLERAASNLDPTLSEEDFAAELGRIREKLEKILQPVDGLNPITTRKPTAAELLKKYGGQ